MAKLNQIIAVASGKKSRAQAGITEVYHKLQKTAMLDGISRTYRPKDDDGEKLPAESKRVQLRVADALAEAQAILSDVFDVVATQDKANTTACADVAVDGKVIVPQVPVTTLLFLEKQLTDIHTLVEKLPTLDPADDWEYSAEADCWASKPYETTRTKKIPRNHVLAEATKEHPAQVNVFTEDVVVGFWQTTKFSGAIPESSKRDTLKRVRKLQDAVKAAREEANGADVKDVQIAKPLFAFIFEQS
jgi:ACT domain-containing protein